MRVLDPIVRDERGQGPSERVIVAGVLALGAIVALLAISTHLWGHPTAALIPPP